jgi:MFS family permease
MTRLARFALTAVAVLAFADSAIVVLALPQLLRRFDASVVDVSWVLNAYNLTAALTGAALLVARPPPREAGIAGAAVFACASTVCAAAPDLIVLQLARGVQGIGGALILVASAQLIPRRHWQAAGAAGLAAGPALGGLLTQLATWRAIFVVQVPVAVLAVVVLIRVIPAAARRARLPAVVDLAHVLVAAALAGALFLTVVLLVNGWDLTPLEAAVILTIVPVTALAVALGLRGFDAGGAAVAGVAAIAAGLGVLSLLSSESIPVAAVALALAGAGAGLTLAGGLPRLVRHTDEDDAPAQVVARHAGILLGALLLAPLLAGELHDARDEALSEGTRKVATAPLPLGPKLLLGLDLARVVFAAPDGEVPDLAPAFRRAEADADDSRRERLEALHRSLTDVIQNAITRAFRIPYLAAAGLALLAILPIAVALRRRGATGRGAGRDDRSARASPRAVP